MHAIIKKKLREIIHYQSDVNGQTNNMEHEAHMQHSSYYIRVSTGTDKEENWEIRGLFVQSVSVQHNRIPRLYAADSETHVVHRKRTVSERGKRDYVTPIKQSQEANSRHGACDDEMDCIIADNASVNMMMKGSSSPIRSETRTRSG